MPVIKRDKERRSQEEYLREQNRFIKAYKGGYKEIADRMEGKYPEMSWNKYFLRVYAAFNKQIYPRNAHGNPDYRFIRELINTTNEWLEEKERQMQNAIRLSQAIRGLRNKE